MILPNSDLAKEARKVIVRNIREFYYKRVQALLDSDDFSEKYSLSNNALVLHKKNKDFSLSLTTRLAVIMQREIETKEILKIDENGYVEKNTHSENIKDILNPMFEKCFEEALKYYQNE